MCGARILDVMDSSRKYDHAYPRLSVKSVNPDPDWVEFTADTDLALDDYFIDRIKSIKHSIVQPRGARYSILEKLPLEFTARLTAPGEELDAHTECHS